MYVGKIQPSTGQPVTIEAYCSVGPTTYRRSPSGSLAAQLTQNPTSTWYSGGAQVASMDDDDNQYRKVSVHAPSGPTFTSLPASPQLAGTFNPAKINEFDPLSRVPLGVYEPVAAAPADPAANRALHGSDLLPNQNLGGYVSQPVDLVTTLSALPALDNGCYDGTSLPVNDPISVVRVRVAGVLRTPGRAAVGAVSLAVGVTALTILAAVIFAFRAVVVGALLVTTAAALIPAQALRRLPAAQLLAEE